MREEPQESDGHRVLRHLQGIVAWHAAATSLVRNRKSRFPQSLVGLVEVTPTKMGPDLMTVDEVTEEFFFRYPALSESPEARNFFESITGNYLIKTEFSDTTHAEAVLIGFVSYFSPGSHSVNHGPPINEDDLQFLRRLVGLVCCQSFTSCI